MARSVWTAGALVAIVTLALCGATASSSRAASSAAICKTFSVNKVKYQWSVIGNVSCKKAKPWLTKILGHKGKPGAKVVYRNGPKGFHCSGTNDAKGRPFAGGCYTGTLAYPKNGFQWFG